jgi:hypothetical protein
MAVMATTRYRWRMTRRRRIVKVTLLGLIGLFFLSGLLDGQLSLWWRFVTLVGLVSSVLAIRTVVGAVLIVSDKGLRIQKTWPYRRDIAWYRILATDVIPGFWNLELELNSGERLELPPVADINGLYEDIERHRTALDA